MTSPSTTFPGGLTEIEFVEAYRRHTLLRPQVVADLTLRALAFADPSERATLSGVIAQQFVEAARRLVAVFEALGDRRYSVGRSLLRPLPGPAEWRTFAHAAATWAPEQVVRELSLGDDALPSARRLRSQPDLADLSDLVAAGCGAAPLLLAPPGQAGEAWLASPDSGTEPITASFGTDVQDAAALADVTGDLVAIASGFLASYAGARRGAAVRVR
jgi:hypothetical protein